jgi:hypothetical protein
MAREHLILKWTLAGHCFRRLRMSAFDLVLRLAEKALLIWVDFDDDDDDDCYVCYFS